MRIGVTGNYASGKGTVCTFLSELGAIVIDTDIIARDIVQAGSPALSTIISTFGDSFLNPDGSLKRRELAQYVFADTKRTELLNKITHPVILEKTLKLSSNPENIYAINTPLLFESGFDSIMDIIITVSATHENMIQRGNIRDSLTPQEIKTRLSRQFSLNEKADRSDYIIDNSGTLENTKEQVVTIWNKIINKNPK